MSSFPFFNPLTGEVRYYQEGDIVPSPWERNFLSCPGGSCDFNESVGPRYFPVPYQANQIPSGMTDAFGKPLWEWPEGVTPPTDGTPTFRVDVEYVNWIPWAILLAFVTLFFIALVED